MTDRITVFKAQPTGDEVIPDLHLSAIDSVPTVRSNEESVYRPALSGIFTEDATRIVDALTASLPGGTIDRILAILLQRKSSIYVIRDTDMMKGEK